MITCQYPICGCIKTESNGKKASCNKEARKHELQLIKDAEKKQLVPKRNTLKPKKQKAITKHSEENHYTCSDTGEIVSRAEAERRIRKTKAELLGDMMYEHDYIFCQHVKEDGKECGKSCDIRDCSHEVSILECINSGQIELSWWIGNFKVRCREHHNEWDKSGLQWASISS